MRVAVEIVPPVVVPDRIEHEQGRLDVPPGRGEIMIKVSLPDEFGVLGVDRVKNRGDHYAEGQEAGGPFPGESAGVERVGQEVRKQDQKGGQREYLHADIDMEGKADTKSSQDIQ